MAQVGEVVELHSFVGWDPCSDDPQACIGATLYDLSSSRWPMYEQYEVTSVKKAGQEGRNVFWRYFGRLVGYVEAVPGREQ